MTRERTGWPPGLLQDDCGKLARWFETRIDARWTLRKVIAERKSMRTKQPEACEHGMPATFGCDACTINRMNATLRTQHALLERAWNNLDAATSYSRKSARDSHSKLLADLTAHLEPKP